MKTVRLRGGPPVHPYLYSKRLLSADRGLKDGEVARLVTREGREVGYGIYNRRSLIAIRVLSHDPEIVPDEAWLRTRIREADRLRREVLRLPETTNAWRVVHAEADGLSGLVVDRFGDVGSVALFSIGWQRRLDELLAALKDEAGLSDVVVRADPKSATQEGIQLPPPQAVGVVEVEENGVRYRVDPSGGHKTGFFLDQRDNRRRLASIARGRTVFDGMTYTGGFALACARAGATSVRGMDLDEDAIAVARKNATLNGLDVRFEHGDVFHALRELAASEPEARPEILIIDPPKWARDRAGLGAALYRYRDLNRLALEAVRPGGIVCSCSCSGLVQEADLIDVIRGAALDVRRSVKVLGVSGAAPDHPVATLFPEGRYLKCVLLQVGAPGSGPGGGSENRGSEESRGGSERRGGRADRGDGEKRGGREDRGGQEDWSRREDRGNGRKRDREGPTRGEEAR